jgi:hypothetical protein
MIIVISKIQVRRGLESELSSLDVAELAMTTDSGRLFIGHDPTVGNPNFNRTDFPFENVEVLTENSPRVAELFSQNVRDQDRNDFFYPTVIPASQTSYAPLTYLDYEGGVPTPAHFYGGSISAAVDYHAFKADVGGPLPVKQGTLRLMGTPTSAQIQDNDNFDLSSNQLQFQLSAQQTDTFGNDYFELQVRNLTGVDITILIRRVSIIGISA